MNTMAIKKDYVQARVSPELKAAIDAAVMARGSNISTMTLLGLAAVMPELSGAIGAERRRDQAELTLAINKLYESLPESVLSPAEQLGIAALRNSAAHTKKPQ